MAVNTQSNLDLTTTSDQVTISYDYGYSVFIDKSTKNGPNVNHTPSVSASSTYSSSSNLPDDILGNGDGNWLNHGTYYYFGGAEDGTDYITIEYSEQVTINTFKLLFSTAGSSGHPKKITIEYGDTTTSLNNLISSIEYTNDEYLNSKNRSTNDVTDYFVTKTFNNINAKVFRIKVSEYYGTPNPSRLRVAGIILGESLEPNHYKIEKSTDNVTYTLLTDTHTTKSYTDTGLNLDTVYFYRVSATTNPLTKDIVVKTQAKTSSHPANGSGSGTGYLLDGVESPNLTLFRGGTYKFDQSDSTNNSHPLLFYLDEDKTTQYSTGVTTAGTPSQSGAYTQIVVASDAPNEIWYQCGAHSNMGWKFTISDREFGNTSERAIATSILPPTNLELKNVGDGESVDISWNKGGGSTSLIKSNIDGGDFNNLQVNYANNTLKNESLDKTKIYKYRVSSTGTKIYSIIPTRVYNPELNIATDDIISKNSIDMDWDWFRNKRTIPSWSSSRYSPEFHTMDDYIYMDFGNKIVRKNMITGQNESKNWGSSGSTESYEGFSWTSGNNIHIWKDTNSNKVWLLQYLGYSKDENADHYQKRVIKAICLTKMFDENKTAAESTKFIRFNSGPNNPSTNLLSYASCMGNGVNNNKLFLMVGSYSTYYTPQTTVHDNRLYTFTINDEPQDDITEWTGSVNDRGLGLSADRNGHYSYLQKAHMIYVENDDWPNGLVMMWNWNGRSNYADFKDNPEKGRILFYDIGNTSIEKKNISYYQYDRNSSSGPDPRMESRRYSRVDSSKKYVFYYNRGYHVQNVTNYNRSVARYGGYSSSYKTFMGLLFFEIPNEARDVDPRGLNLNILKANSQQYNLETNWNTLIKPNYPDGYNLDYSTYLAFWKLLPYWGSENQYNSYMHDSTSVVGFNCFTFYKNGLYCTCSEFRGKTTLNTELYKLNFLDNVRVEFPDLKNAISRTVKNWRYTHQTTYSNETGHYSLNSTTGVMTYSPYSYTISLHGGNQRKITPDSTGEEIDKFLVDVGVNVNSDYVETLEFQPYHNNVQNINLTPAKNQITVDWDSLPVDVFYKIEKSDNFGTTYSLLDDKYPISSYTNTGLNSETIYIYKVSFSEDDILTKNIAVKTQPKTTSHPAHGTGSGTGYLLEYTKNYSLKSIESPNLTLFRGATYKFDQSDSTNSGHPLLFYEDEGKATQYSTGVTTEGTPGQSGAYTQIVVASDAPNEIWYQCGAHSNMGWKFTISDRTYKSTVEKGISTTGDSPSNLEVTNVGDGQSVDISWNKGGGSTSLVKSSIDGGAFNNLQVDYANNTFKNESLDKTKVYKYRVFSTGNVEYSIVPKVYNPIIDLSVEPLVSKKIALDWDWYENNKSFYGMSEGRWDTYYEHGQTAYTMDDYIYINTSKQIARKNIITGEKAGFSWGDSGDDETMEGFKKAQRNVHIWKDSGREKTWLVKYLGTSKSDGDNSGSKIIKAICISDLFNGVARSECIKYIKCNGGPSAAYNSIDHTIYATAFGENSIFTIPQPTNGNAWGKITIPTQPETGEWNATYTSLGNNGSTWSGAYNTYEHYQHGYTAYVKNSNWPDGVVIAWGFKGKEGNDWYRLGSNPVRGKIFYMELTGTYQVGNINNCNWDEFDAGNSELKGWVRFHPNAKVDDNNNYAFYYSRGYKKKGAASYNSSYFDQANNGKAGLMFFKIGTKNSLDVSSFSISYSRLLGGNPDNSDTNSDTWFDEFKQNNPRGFQGSRTDWVEGFAKMLPPDGNVRNAHNWSYWSLTLTNVGFDVFTIKGNYIYGKSSKFTGAFGGYIYKVNFLNNKRIEWPDIQNVTSYTVTYKQFEGNPYIDMVTVPNNYYQYFNVDLPGHENVGAGVSKVLVKYQVPIQTDYVESAAIQPYHNTPQNVSLTAANNEVTLTYDNIPVPARFKIEKQNNEGVFTTLTDTNSLTTYTDSALSPGNAYFYRISLSDDNGTTFYNTVTKSVVVSILGPSITSTLNDKTVSLTWEGLGDKFDIQRSENGGNFTDLAGAQDLIVKQYDNTNLVYNTDYQYRIKGKEFDVSFNVIPTTIGEDYLVKNITIPQEFIYEDTFHMLPKLNTSGSQNNMRFNFSLVKLNDDIITVGGIYIKKYNPSTDDYTTWRQYETGGQGISGTSVPSGYVSTDKLMKNNEWPNDSQRSYIFVYNNKIYSFLGGDTTNNYTNDKMLTSSDYSQLGDSIKYNKTYTMAGTKIIDSTPKEHGVSAHNHKKYLYTFGGVKKINGVSKLRRYDLDSGQWSPYNDSDNPGWITIPTSLEDTPQNCNLVYVNTTSFPETLFVFGGNLNSHKIWSIDIANFGDNNYKQDSDRFVEQTFDSTGLTFQSENIDWKNFYENLPFNEQFTYVSEKNGFRNSEAVVHDDRWIIFTAPFKNNIYVIDAGVSPIKLYTLNRRPIGDNYIYKNFIKFSDQHNYDDHNFIDLTNGINSPLFIDNGILYHAFNGLPSRNEVSSNHGCAFKILSIKLSDIENILNWVNVPNKTTYTIEDSTDDFATTTTLATGHAAPPYTLSEKPDGTKKFRVSTKVTQESVFTETDTITPIDGQIQNVVFNNPSTNSVNISFSQNAIAYGYKLERKRVDVAGSYVLRWSSSINTLTSFGDTGLVPGGLYFYRIKGMKNASEDYQQATKKAFISNLNKPAFSSTSSGNKKNILNWTSIGSDKYILERSSDGGDTYSVISDNITGTTYTDTGLTNNTDYKYRITGKEKTYEIPATFDSNTNKASWNVEDLTILGKFTLLKKETGEDSFSVIKENISETAKETTVDVAHQSATAEYKIRFKVDISTPLSLETGNITPKHPATGNPNFGTEGVSKIEANLTSLVIEFSNSIQSGRANSNELSKDDFEITKTDKNGNSTVVSISSYVMSNNKITFSYPSNLNNSDAEDTFNVSYTKNTDEDYNLYDSNNRFLANLLSIKQASNLIPPGKVSWASVKAGNRQTKLSWVSVAGASYYKVQVKKDNGNYQDYGRRISNKRNSATITNLKNNSNYKFKIKAVKTINSVDIEGDTSDESIISEVKALVGFTTLTEESGLSVISTTKKNKLDSDIATLSESTDGSVRKNFEDNKTSLIDSNKNLKFEDVPRVRETFKSILTAFDDIADENIKKKKKRQARAEAIKLIFDLDEGILTFEADAEDLNIQVFENRANKYKITLPKGNDINVVTLDVEQFTNTPDYQAKGYYIPMTDGESAIFKFGDNSLLLEKVIENDIEKVYTTLLDGNVQITNLISQNQNYDINDTVNNYLLPDDTATINGVDITIGSINFLAAQAEGSKPKFPGRKQHKSLASGFFEHPGSVVNNLFMSGNFGSGLSNRKLVTLNKNQTQYKDYRLGTKPSEGEPHKHWSQPVRPNIGSGGRLARLKAKAIKKSN